MRYIATYLVAMALTGCAVLAPPPKPQVQPGEELLKLTLANFPGPGSSNLGALKGKVVLVDFWATWCGPCHEASQGYQGLYQAFHARGLEVYGVSLDDDASEIPAFLQQQGVTYPILLDPGAAVSGPRFGLQSIPSVLLADRTGRIRFASAGYSDDELAALRSQIEQLLAEPPPGEGASAVASP